MPGAPLRLFNSLSRREELFAPLDPAHLRVYSCGPTVYAYAHIGNLRAYVFTDTLARVLRWKAGDMGWGPLTHVLNLTDVGHLTDDADAGDDKLERAASASGEDIWSIAARYAAAFRADLAALGIVTPTVMPLATDHVAGMVAWGEAIAERHCYRLPDGLYFDTSTVPDYGRLARADTASEEVEGRIAAVAGKRHPADFAIWRTTPPGERRQMEWDSPWGRGAPGWHLECSVMSRRYLGERFDVHTGGIDHREIHHPNEIAQNQALSGTPDTGATFWLHNNFLVERSEGDASAKMSKSAGDFTRLATLTDAGFHPLAFRLLCLQAHYRSELEFSWEGLRAALVRLRRLVGAAAALRARPPGPGQGSAAAYREQLDLAVSADLNTPRALTVLEAMLADKAVAPHDRLAALADFDAVLGLGLAALERADLRLRPAGAAIDAAGVAAALRDRREARAQRDFARSDAIRDELAAAGVEVMDGDPLGWEWRV